MSINLKCPSTGLFFQNAYTKGKTRAMHDFSLLRKQRKFAKYILNLPKHEGVKSMGEQFKRDLLMEESKPSNFIRFLGQEDPLFFLYSIDINWQKDGNGCLRVQNNTGLST